MASGRHSVSSNVSPLSVAIVLTSWQFNSAVWTIEILSCTIYQIVRASRVYASNKLLCWWHRGRLPPSARVQAHRAGSSRRVIIRSAIKTVPLLTSSHLAKSQRCFVSVCVQGWKAKTPGLLSVSMFSSGRQGETRRSVVHHSWAHQSLPVRAEPQLICGQDRPLWLVRTLRVLLLKDSGLFSKSILAQKSGTYHRLSNFVSQRTSPDSLKWIITSWLQILFSCAHLFLLKDPRKSLSRKERFPWHLFCYLLFIYFFIFWWIMGGIQLSCRLL